MEDRIYLDCYFHQDNEMMYEASREFPSNTYWAFDFAMAYRIAPTLGKTFDRIVISRKTKGQNPIPVF